MIINMRMFRKVVIAGIGLIGGSLGLAIRKHQLAREIVGLSNKHSTLVEAMKVKAIDTGFTDIPKALHHADLIILATPVDAIVTLMTAMNPHIKRGCIVTDVGSAKANIVEAAERNLTHFPFFVGSHPLAGSEKKGVQFARDDLFQGANCIITPTNKTYTQAQEKVAEFWTKLGSKVKVMSPDEHDQTLAYVSHIPHLLAYGLMETIPENVLEFASRGLKDTSRIAASTPLMWKDICMANSRNILRALDEFVARLALYRQSIVKRDEKALIEHFEEAKRKRDLLQ
jgi:prephenate dehydrogenase